MIRFITFLLQVQQQAVAAESNWFKDYGWAVILLLLTNGIQFAINFRQNRSASRKTDADTIQLLLKSIDELRNGNDKLYEKMQGIRRGADKLERERDDRKELADDGIELLNEATLLLPVTNDTVKLRDKIKLLIERNKEVKALYDSNAIQE